MAHRVPFAKFRSSRLQFVARSRLMEDIAAELRDQAQARVRRRVKVPKARRTVEGQSAAFSSAIGCLEAVEQGRG